jgi:hypothetical protein
MADLMPDARAISLIDARAGLAAQPRAQPRCGHSSRNIEIPVYEKTLAYGNEVWSGKCTCVKSYGADKENQDWGGFVAGVVRRSAVRVCPGYSAAGLDRS